MTAWLLATSAQTFDVSLPQVKDSLMGYGKSANGAVSDKLFCTLGGCSVISQLFTRSNIQKLGLDVGWRSDLQCDNFDLETTVGNQFNGMTNSFKNLMGDVVQGATNAVASLPAMMIQRANHGLYEMLTNSVLEANVSFDKVQLNCQSMAKCMVDFSDSRKWTQQAAMDEYKRLVNSGDADALSVNDAGEKVTDESGSNWVGGEKRGGHGQRAIHPTHDLSAAGYNMMNHLPVSSSGSCLKFSSSEAAAAAVVKMLGDRSIRIWKDVAQCTDVDIDQQPSASVAGTGFSPMLEEATRINGEQLVKLVNGAEKPNAKNLAKLRTDSLAINSGVINALQCDPDNVALVGRLSGELAIGDTVEISLLLHRMIVTGYSGNA